MRQEGIAYKIVPGVTAALGATACAGIPLTHRLHASAVALITGHEQPGKSPEGRPVLDWEALARFPGTLVFYMAIARMEEIVAELIRHGKPADTPSAAIHRGSTAQQRTVDRQTGRTTCRRPRRRDRGTGPYRYRRGGSAPRGIGLVRGTSAVRKTHSRHPAAIPGSRSGEPHRGAGRTGHLPADRDHRGTGRLVLRGSCLRAPSPSTTGSCSQARTGFMHSSVGCVRQAGICVPWAVCAWQ